MVKVEKYPKRLGIRIDPETKTMLRALAEKRETTVSNLIRWLVHKELQQE